jgi:hypothetical protein
VSTQRVLLALLLVLLTGCAGPKPTPLGPPTGVANPAAVQAVKDELRRGEEVVAVFGGYESGPAGGGRVELAITVPPGTPVEEQEAVLDRAEQLVWRSPVDPLSSVVLLVREPRTGPTDPVRQRSYDGPVQIAQLEETYGPR